LAECVWKSNKKAQKSITWDRDNPTQRNGKNTGRGGGKIVKHRRETRICTLARAKNKSAWGSNSENPANKSKPG